MPDPGLEAAVDRFVVEGAMGADVTATVAVYWGVSLASYGPLDRARHRAPTAWRLHCPICGANGLQQDCRSSHTASFVADVTTEEVLAEALDLLATETATAPAG